MPEPEVDPNIGYPTGGKILVNNVLHEPDGTVTVTGESTGSPEGDKVQIVAKMYTGTPYTSTTAPAAPPTSAYDSDLGEDAYGYFGPKDEMMAGIPWEVTCNDVPCSSVEGPVEDPDANYPVLQLIVWARNYNVALPSQDVTFGPWRREIVSDLKGQAQRASF